MQIWSYGYTDKGPVREKNEDSFLVDDQQFIYAVADGIGGLPYGKLASHLSTNFLQIYTKGAGVGGVWPDLSRVMPLINQAVSKTGELVSPLEGIGSTLTIVSIRGNSVFVGHVGDSAAFLFKHSGEFYKLTKDQTMEQEILDNAEPGEVIDIPEEYHHTLTSCMGIPDMCNPFFNVEELEPGDKLLICSDGVTNVLTKEDMHAILYPADDVETCTKQIVELSIEKGTQDNATAVCIMVQ
tara:strand:- start:1038 stop:1757 length:720 start_codon:yes stop_codon:yes gene_type:complete